MPMQPSPVADTSRLLFPSLRFCIVSPSELVSLIPRLESNARKAVARSFRFIAYSSRYVKNHWCFRSRAAILGKRLGNQYNEKPQQKCLSGIKSSARIAQRAGSQDCLVHGLRRESGNGHSRRDAPPKDRPDRSLFSNLRAGRDCHGPGPKAGKPP